ncbi:S41 family peptidase [Neomicrococcus lactis]|uniref:Tricorn protease n=1 Tax=Neomicrococcus lactis TaxID=732241 RepID=A0A7W8Y987_9MICC|nr:S41 family peptidase [Neomicrococcus lactis]MBB5597298.1 tricorn protease [Neomicrococcus lactis]
MASKTGPSSSYLRYPHLHNDQVTFVAEDDVWIASLDGGRATRISTMHLPARNPQFTPDGESLVWSVVQRRSPEVVTAHIDGGGFKQLSYWGSSTTRMRGFTPDGNVLAITAYRQSDYRHTWARSVPLDGGPTTLLQYGPVDSVIWGQESDGVRPVVLGSALTREPAYWKRYRGGAAGKLWIDRHGSGQFERLVPEITSNLCLPQWIGGRIAFLSDHEGYGNVYSVLPDGSDIRRHTDHVQFYARHLASDGERLIYEHRGKLFVLDSLDSESRRLDIQLASSGNNRRRTMLVPTKNLKAATPDVSGSTSVVETHGTLHLLLHKDGPSHMVEATPGVRARLGRVLDPQHVAYVADHGGEEALYIRDLTVDGPFASTAAIGLPASDDDAFHDWFHEPYGEADENTSTDIATSRASGNSADKADAVASASDPRTVALDAKPDQELTARADGVMPDSPVENEAEKPDLSTAHPHSSTRDVRETVGVDGTDARETSETDSGQAGLTRIELPVRGRPRVLEVSPDGRWIGLGTEYGEAYLLNVREAKWRLLGSTDYGAISHLSFSPDSGWVAWIEPVTAHEGRSRLLLASTTQAAREPILVTDGRFHDHSPSFTLDGQYLAFLSERSFDPVYDTHSFDLSFPASTKPFMVSLADNTPSPFGPSAYSATGHNRSVLPSGQTPSTTNVDGEGIAQRLFAVPVSQGRYSRLVAVNNALLWLVDESVGVTGDGTTDSGGSSLRLQRFDLEQKKTTTLVNRLSQFRVSGDKKKLVYINGIEVRCVPTDRSVEVSSADALRLDLNRIRVELEPAKVWGQMFNETWRLQRDFFWTEDMAGLDWENIAKKYRPLIERLGSHDDLVDILLELHGELGTSHAYVSPFAAMESGAGYQGLFGADLARQGDGKWVISRLLEGDSSDPQAYPPLRAPGVGVREGDAVLGVDGQIVPTDVGPEALLTSAAGKTVELTIEEGPNGRDPGSIRRVAFVPLQNEERLRYQDWVATNRQRVRDASDGNFGYLHVPDMSAQGWAQLHRDLDVETSKDALIVDVRRNRGGHTSQLVAELIGRKVTAWTMAREMRTGTYPSSAPRGPLVLLTDEWAGSDGDIITQVTKLRNLGPVVGMRTWGGVVGIDNLFDLADGTKVTQPRYATWFTQGVGWGIENRGVSPDVEVPYPPHAYTENRDPQLERALEVLAELHAEHGTARPPLRSGYSSLQPGPLPPRPQYARRAGEQ